jgi:hypothetical protein
MFTGKRTHVYLLLLFGLLVRSVSFVLSKNYDGDAIIRTMMGADWLRDPFIITHANPVTWVFGPLHYYLIGLSLLVWDNLWYSPRLVSLILGTLTIIPFYYLIEPRLGKKAATYATSFFCLYTLHVRYSAVATSEAPYLFLLIVSIFLFFRFRDGGKIGFLLLSAAFLNLATMMRYDAILFVAILGILLLVNQDGKPRFELTANNLQKVVLFAFVSLVFIVIWLVGDFRFNQDAFYSISTAQADHLTLIKDNIARRGYLLNTLYNLLFWPAVIFLSLSPVIFVLALIGLFKSAIRLKHVDLLALFLVVYVSYAYQSTIGESLAPFARYSTTLGVFLLPFAGAGLSSLITSISEKKGRLLASFSFASMVLCFAIMIPLGVPGKPYLRDKISSVSPVTFLPYYVEELITWVDQNVSSSETIILDSHAHESILIRFYSKLSDQQVKMRWENEDELMQFILRHKPKYLLYSPDGEIRNLFQLDPADSIQKEKGLVFQLLFKTKNYQVYQITY